jgi:predicted aspartyl protease
MMPQAFTLTSQSRLRTLITPVSMRQALLFCREFNLPCQQAEVRALWDTGASGSCISRGLANHLGLKPVDICNVSGVNGIHQSAVYKIDIVLPSNVTIDSVRVSEFMDNGAFEIIIGMDIITLGDFAISNKDRKITVSFRIPPRDEPIDFLTEV